MRLDLRGSAVCLLLGLYWAPATYAEENPAVVETLAILRERGMIDDAKYAELVAKNQTWESSQQSLLSRLEWSGDVRGRFENFWYQEDDFGVDTADRNRARYRLRVGVRAKVNEVATAGFRLASGENDPRSTNETFGKESDFGPDALWIDQAYLELNTPGRFLPEGMTLKSTLGKQANPFLWKKGLDYMIWDNDITPEGVAFQIAGSPTEMLSLFGNAGYFISDENSSSEDPHVFGIQGGFGLAPSDDFDFGARVSFYDWGSVNSAFLTSSADDGSVLSTAGDYSVVELATYAGINTFEEWPILLYGQIAQNLDAEGSPGAGDQDLGWGGGIEVGDKKKFVKLGVGYYHLEANFSPAQFTDSDLFDGYTNREGFVFYASRELLENTDLNLTFFSGDSIEDGPAFDIGTVTMTTVPSADRYRLQTDLVVKF